MIAIVLLVAVSVISSNYVKANRDLAQTAKDLNKTKHDLQKAVDDLNKMKHDIEKPESDLNKTILASQDALPETRSNLGAAAALLARSSPALSPSEPRKRIVYNGEGGKICTRTHSGRSWNNDVQCVEGANQKPNSPLTILDWVGGPSIYFITTDNHLSGIDYIPRNDTWVLSPLRSHKIPTHDLSQLASVT